MFSVTIILPGGERVSQRTRIPYIAGDAINAVDKRGNYFPLLMAIEVVTDNAHQTVTTR